MSKLKPQKLNFSANNNLPGCGLFGEELWWVQLELLLALFADVGGHHDFLLGGVGQEANSFIDRGSDITVTHEFEEGLRQWQVDEPIVLQHLGKEHSQEVEVAHCPITGGRVLGQRCREQSALSPHVVARVRGALWLFGALIITQPEAEVAALQFGGDQGVEFKGGTKACAFFTGELDF